MKILYIVPSMHPCGVLTVVMNYYRAFDKKDMQIDFATFYIGDDLRKEIENNNGNIYLIHNKNKHPLKRFNDIYQIIKKNSYDIIEMHCDSASVFLDLFAAKLAGAKVRIAHAHSTGSLLPLQHRLLKPLLPSVVTHRFACSKEVSEYMFYDGDFKLINNGLDFDKFKFNESIRNKIRKEFNWEDKFILGNVGNDNPDKNQIFSVKLMEEIYKTNKDIKLVLVGSVIKEAQDYIQEHHLEDCVECLGVRKNVPEILNGFDLFLFPSINEGSPAAIIEASANGLPCIVSESAQSTMVPVTFNENYYNLPFDINQWKDLILEMKHKNIKHIIITEEKKKSSGFDINELAKDLKKTYEDIISNQ